MGERLAGLPIWLPLSKKVTVPVGAPPPGVVTVAVKVMVPGALGFAEEATLVVVEA
jgi:hypothetical protein